MFHICNNDCRSMCAEWKYSVLHSQICESILVPPQKPGNQQPMKRRYSFRKESFVSNILHENFFGLALLSNKTDWLTDWLEFVFFTGSVWVKHFAKAFVFYHDYTLLLPVFFCLTLHKHTCTEITNIKSNKIGEKWEEWRDKIKNKKTKCKWKIIFFCFQWLFDWIGFGKIKLRLKVYFTFRTKQWNPLNIGFVFSCSVFLHCFLCVCKTWLFIQRAFEFNFARN